jgi:type IV pilus assembly protein PilQ
MDVSANALFWGLLILLLCCPVQTLAEPVARSGNRLLAVSAEESGGVPTVLIRTQEPVGYRYTVYDSTDPLRVVIDFPNMDVTAVAASTKVDLSPLQEVRVSSFDLTSGRLGRVELLLGEKVGYNVALAGNEFRVTFGPVAGAPPVTPAPVAAEATAPGTAAESAAAPPQAAAPPPEAAAAAAAATEAPAVSEPVKPASKVVAVEMRPNRADIVTDGRVEQYQYFVLKAPPRLVVDISGVKPAFKEKAFKAGQGLSQVRVGAYPDKTRFVFDAAGSALPRHSVGKREGSVVVSWGDAAGKVEEAAGEKAAAAPAAPAAAVPVPAAPAKAAKAGKAGKARGPLEIEAIDLLTENGQTVLQISLSGPGEITEAKAQGNVVRFGVRNATISRALRRTLDASAFPSAVRLVTPYTVKNNGGQDVRFAVELKGPAPYRLVRDGNVVRLLVENGPYAEAKPAALTQIEKPLPAGAALPSATGEAPPAAEMTPAAGTALIGPGAAEPPKYTGQKITLVFDDADIRKILQLIAEVSELNIIAGDEVKGTISLRLVDVPWDQALDLIMDIKGLGMLREGNVVRVLPKAQLREAEEAKLTAARNKEKLDNLVTEAITVSYTNLSNVSIPAKEMLTERGKITEDARNKMLIVHDVPSVVAEIKALVALLDTPEKQVMIEARIVEANSSFSRDLGVRWGLSYDNDAGGPWDPSTGSIGGGGAFLLSPPAAGGVGPAGLGSSITFGRVGIDSVTLNLRLSALETSGTGKVISTPRVTTLNGGQAVISQGTKIPYQSVSDKGTETKFENAELKLDVKPVINPDNSIILDIKASNSSVGEVVPSGEGEAVSIEEKKAETKVLVRDGETTVIGGIFVDDERQSVTGIPLLRSIPVLGHLFKSTSVSNQRRELLIFITPRIVN